MTKEDMSVLKAFLEVGSKVIIYSDVKQSRPFRYEGTILGFSDEHVLMRDITGTTRAISLRTIVSIAEASR